LPMRLLLIGLAAENPVRRKDFIMVVVFGYPTKIKCFLTGLTKR